jgi:hypothetical protein
VGTRQSSRGLGDRVPGRASESRPG